MPRGDRFGIVHPHERAQLRPICGGSAAIDLLAQLRAMTYGRARPIAGGRERSLAELEPETGIPARTMRRALHVLVAVRMVERTQHGRGSCLTLTPVMSPGALAGAVTQAKERGDLKAKRPGGVRRLDSGESAAPNMAAQGGQLGRGEAPPLNQRASADFEPRENLEAEPTTTPHPAPNTRQGGASDRRGVVVVEGLSPVGNIGGAAANVLGRVRIVPKEAVRRGALAAREKAKATAKAAQKQRVKGLNSQGDSRVIPPVLRLHGPPRNAPKCLVSAADLEAEAERIRGELGELRTRQNAIKARQAGARRAWLEAHPKPPALASSSGLRLGAAVSHSGDLPWPAVMALSRVLASVRPCYLSPADVGRLTPTAGAWEALRGPGESDSTVAVRVVEDMVRERGSDPATALEDWCAAQRAEAELAAWLDAEKAAFAAIDAPDAAELAGLGAAPEERTARLRAIDQELAEHRRIAEHAEAVERDLAHRAATIAAAPRDRLGRGLADAVAVLETRGHLGAEDWALDAIPFAAQQPNGIGSWLCLLEAKAKREAQAEAEIAGARLELEEAGELVAR